jgi:hypothetical protein
MFTGPGPSEDDARVPSVSAFLETEPGSYKPLDECSPAEIQAKIMSLMMQAQALLDEAKTLGQYLEDEL